MFNSKIRILLYWLLEAAREEGLPPRASGDIVSVSRDSAAPPDAERR
jgi:hypothetical protein